MGDYDCYYYSRGTTLPIDRSTPAVRQVLEGFSWGVIYYTPAELGEQDFAARGTRRTHRGYSEYSPAEVGERDVAGEVHRRQRWKPAGPARRIVAALSPKQQR